MVERLARSSSAPHRTVVQERALLRQADEASVRSAAKAIGSHPDTVTRWRDRYLVSGPEGIGVIAEGRGRKPEISDAVIEAIVTDATTSVPRDGSTSGTTRTLGAKRRVAKDTVARIWRARNRRPWQVHTFKLSNDPQFEAKLIDVVGLYVDPPERAMA